MNTTDPAHFVIWPSPVAPLASRRTAAGRDAATLTLELTAEDLRHFRRELDRARASVRSADDEELLELATEQIASLRSISLPAFVAIRIERLDQMRAMVADTGWHLDQAERDLIFGVLAYVCDPEDMIPDAVPGIGLLDDAVMIELAWRELRHEVEAHRESGAASA
jgi:uncharacterized membrane protein YkvA (DUF1232 family)